MVDIAHKRPIADETFPSASEFMMEALFKTFTAAGRGPLAGQPARRNAPCGRG